MCWHPLETDVRSAGDQLVHYRPDCGAVPRSELVEPCGTPADVVQHHRVFTKAGARVPCWKRRLREAPSAVNLWFAAGLPGCLKDVGAL